MPLDYAIETDVKPIIRDFKTGAVIDPGGAGAKYVVDRRGKRVPYEILPDDAPSPGSKRGRGRIKNETPALYQLPKRVVKPEGQDQGASIILIAGSTRRGTAQDTARLNPSTWKSSREKNWKPGAQDAPSGDESSEDDCSNLSDSFFADTASVPIKPSRSPSWSPDTPSPSMGSRGRVNQHHRSVLVAPMTPSPSQTDCHTRHRSRPPSRPVSEEITPSPATSRVHGWNPINKPKKIGRLNILAMDTQKSSDSSAVRSIPTEPAAMARVKTTQPSRSTRHHQAATAGPSSGAQGSALPQDSPRHSLKARHDYHVVQALGKSTDDQDQEDVRSSKKQKLKDRDTHKATAEKKYKKQQMRGKASPPKRHGPSRQARIERSIEETPPSGLLTPILSATTGQAPDLNYQSPVRFESNMFMTSPVQPATPGFLSQHTPQTSLAPMNSPPPTHSSRKRCRSVYEDAKEDVIDSVVRQRSERQRLEQAIDNESCERKRIEQEWEEQFVRQRIDNWEERKRFELDQSEFVQSYINDRVSSLSTTLQKQIGGQQKRNEDHIQNLTRRLDDLERREKARQDITNIQPQRPAAGTCPVGRVANQQRRGNSRSSRAKWPQAGREVRPREGWDLGVRGWPTKPVNGDTLIRGERGKRDPRTLAPYLQRDLRQSGSSSSRPVQHVARDSNAFNTGSLNEDRILAAAATASSSPTSTTTVHREYNTSLSLSQPAPVRTLPSRPQYHLSTPARRQPDRTQHTPSNTFPRYSPSQIDRFPHRVSGPCHTQQRSNTSPPRQSYHTKPAPPKK